jgi:hypothetical protein
VTRPAAIRVFLEHQFVVYATLILLGAALVLFASAGVDDSYITYWAAHSLAHTGSVTNLNGLPVEQSSTLLMVLWLGGLHALTGVEISTLGGLTSLVFAVLTFRATSTLARRVDPALSPWAVMLVASSLWFLFWAYSGAEETLLLWLLITFISCLADVLTETRARMPWIRFGVVTLLLLLVRPESPVLVGSILAGLGVFVALNRLETRVPLARFGIAVAIAVALAGVIFVVRKSVFGMYFPLPVEAKVQGMSSATLTLGYEYVTQSHRTTFLAILMIASGCIVLGLAARRRLPLILAVIVLTGCAELSFIVLSGGDWMPYERFIIRMLPFAIIGGLGTVRAIKPSAFLVVAAIVAALNVQDLAGALRGKMKGSGLPVGAELAGTQIARDLPWFVRHHKSYVRDYLFTQKLGVLVERIWNRKHAKVIVMGEHAGAVMYWLQQKYQDKVYFYDRHGITTRDFHDCDVTKHLPRDAFGIGVEWDFYFAHLDEIVERCHMQAPDIIQELELDAPEVFWKDALAHGYVIAAHQAAPGGRGVPEAALVRSDYRDLITDLMPAQ